MTADPIRTREISPLPKRPDDAHKGSVGRLVVIGGCRTATSTMIGAPALAAQAAFRTGAGLVQLAMPAELHSAAATLVPCATLRNLPTGADELAGLPGAFAADAVAFGPGLGESLSLAALQQLLARYVGPVVIDADGLNLLATAPPDYALPKPERIVLTPHPGEAQRLLQARPPAGAPAKLGGGFAERKAATFALHEAYRTVVVLKGRATQVTNGQRWYVNETGNSGLATGGTGDVLTGMIAALLGQGLASLEAAILGVYLHGLAGDFGAEELGRHSLLATDLIDFIPEACCDHETFREE